MSALTFRGVPGTVYMRDGAYREITLTEAQCDVLLDTWQAADAESTFNELYEACKDAGFDPCSYGFKRLRLVSNNTAQDVVRNMLRASVELEASIVSKSMEPF